MVGEHLKLWQCLHFTGILKTNIDPSAKPRDRFSPFTAGSLIFFLFCSHLCVSVKAFHPVCLNTPQDPKLNGRHSSQKTQLKVANLKLAQRSDDWSENESTRYAFVKPLVLAQDTQFHISQIYAASVPHKCCSLTFTYGFNHAVRT